MTRNSRPITLSFGCPSPHPSSSAAFSDWIPRCSAFDLAPMLITAWARLRRDESGWEGMVYLRSWTTKATTRGARLVWSTVLLISSSNVGWGLERVGRASAASKSDGESCSPGLGRGILVRFEGEEVVDAEDDVRFFETRLAAERTCLASFSSGKMDCIFGKAVLDRLSGLQMYEHWL